jgi:hypothetical protein
MFFEPDVKSFQFVQLNLVIAGDLFERTLLYKQGQVRLSRKIQVLCVQSYNEHFTYG